MDETQVTGGENVVVDGKVCEVKGYVTMGNGEIKTIYYYQDPDNIFKHSTGYLDSNNQFKEIKVLDTNSQKYLVDNEEVYFHHAEYIENGKVVHETFTPGKTDQASINNPFTNGYQLKYKDYVVIEGKSLYVEGYVTMPNGEKRVIYNNNGWGTYYLDSNGKLQKAVVNGKWVIEGTYHNAGFDNNEPFEPSEIDKKFLTGNNNVNNQSTSTSSTTVTPSTPSAIANIEYNLDSLLTVKRKRYWVSYYDMYWKSSKKYEAKEGRQLVIDTFNNTPGQGKAAEASCIRFEKNIGAIIYILNEVHNLAKYAIRTSQEPNGLKEKTISELEEDALEITPSIYKKFSEKALLRTPSHAKQTYENSKAKEKAQQARYDIIYSYTSSGNFSEKEMDALKNNATIKEETISETLNGTYSAYLTGKDYIGSVKGITSSKQVSDKTYENDDVYMNYSNVDIIIDDLKIIVNTYILGCNDIIVEQVNKINRIPEYTSNLGILKPEDANIKLIEFRDKIKELIGIYQDKKAAIDAYNKGNGDESTVDTSDGEYSGSSSSRSSSSSSSDSSASPSATPTVATTAPIETTTDTTVEDEKTTPQEDPTNPPQDVPTTPGGPLPSIPVNNNSNGNGNNYNYNNSSNGNYWENNNYSNTSSSETTTPQEVPVDKTFDIKEGNKYKLPTSSRPTTTDTTTTTSSKGNSVIPVLAGISAAAAAGIGAKAYIDRKNNRDNETNEEFKSEDWSTDSDINIEYQEPTSQEAEELEFDGVNDNYEYEAPEKYDARTHQELENLE